MVARPRTITEKPALNAGARPNPAPPPPKSDTLQGPSGYYRSTPTPMSPTALLEARIVVLEAEAAALREVLAGVVVVIDNAAGVFAEYLAAVARR